MELEELSDAVKVCQISKQSEPHDSNETPSLPETILDLNHREKIRTWPRLKPSKIPAIFLHKPTKLEDHLQKILSMKIKFYQPTLSHNFTKIPCVSQNDQKLLIKYFQNKQLPYHTYGNPMKRKMKVVIRGLPKDTPLDKVKTELKTLAIPVIRVHKMKTKDDEGNSHMLLLAVVPYDKTRNILLQLQKLLGHEVTVEPPKRKVTQCYRCQKWGHTERYCHGEVKCVKCGMDHLYKKCTRTKDSNDPPKCANCGGNHTANFKKCPRSPFSVKFELSQMTKALQAAHELCNKRVIVTQENCTELYKKKDHDID